MGLQRRSTYRQFCYVGWLHWTPLFGRYARCVSFPATPDVIVFFFVCVERSHFKIFLLFDFLLKRALMKSASEWLASSDDEGSVASSAPRRSAAMPTTPRPGGGIRRKSRTPSPTIPQSESPTAPPLKAVAVVSQRQIEAEERRRKQEELRERMKMTLGAGTVQAVADSVAMASKKKLTVVTSHSDDSFNNSGTQIPFSHLPPVVPSGRGSIEGRRRSSAIPDHMEEVDVLLADRGTQTVDNASCQTDPDPRVLHCGQCYVDYYGHAPTSVGCAHNDAIGLQHNVSPQHQGGAYGTDPIFASLMQRYQIGYDGGSGGYGGNNMAGRSAYSARSGRPDAGNLANTLVSTALLREQLSSVQTTIDMLISRYNLPPPPGMEHLAVAR